MEQSRATSESLRNSDRTSLILQHWLAHSVWQAHPRILPSQGRRCASHHISLTINTAIDIITMVIVCYPGGFLRVILSKGGYQSHRVPKPFAVAAPPATGEIRKRRSKCGL